MSEEMNEENEFMITGHEFSTKSLIKFLRNLISMTIVLDLLLVVDTLCRFIGPSVYWSVGL